MTDNKINTALAKIMDLIKKNGITNTSLSKQINIPSQTLYNILNKKQRLTVESLINIAEVFNVSIGSFFNEVSEDCAYYKKNFYFLIKYKTLSIDHQDINHYHNLYDYLYNDLIESEKYENLRSIENYDMKLENDFFIDFFNIYEVQELFIKGFYTEKTDGKTNDYKKWVEYESKITVKGHDDAKFIELSPLLIIEVRNGYEKYFSKQIM